MFPSPPQCWDFVWFWTCADLLCAVTVSESSYGYQFCCVWRCCFLGVIDHLWLLQSFHLYIFYISLSLEERTLIRTSHLRLSAPKSLTLWTLSTVGICANYCLWWVSRSVLIYGHCNMSSRVILVMFLWQNRSGRFSLGIHDPPSLCFLTALAVSGMGSTWWSGPEPNLGSGCGHSHSVCVAITSVYLAGGSLLLVVHFGAWVILLIVFFSSNCEKGLSSTMIFPCVIIWVSLLSVTSPPDYGS